VLAEIETRQRQLEARIEKLFSGNEGESEPKPAPENPNESRPMVRLARGFTPEARAEFVQKLKAQGITTMTPEGIAEGRDGPGIIRRG
jgi:hypothetical protein